MKLTGPYIPCNVRIVWNGSAGELDSCTTTDFDGDSVRAALIAMLGNGVVSPGDSFTVEAIDDEDGDGSDDGLSTRHYPSVEGDAA